MKQNPKEWEKIISTYISDRGLTKTGLKKKSSKGKNTLVILMHDTKDVSNSSEALKESIEYLKSEGYTFKNFYNLIEKHD